MFVLLPLLQPTHTQHEYYYLQPKQMGIRQAKPPLPDVPSCRRVTSNGAWLKCNGFLIVGNDNIIEGDGNAVYGDNNEIRGSDVHIVGHLNTHLMDRKRSDAGRSHITISNVTVVSGGNAAGSPPTTYSTPRLFFPDLPGDLTVRTRSGEQKAIMTGVRPGNNGFVVNSSGTVTF